MKALAEKLGKYKYLVLLLAVGLLLLLLPTGSEGGSQTGSDTASAKEARLEEVLSSISGVGEAKILYSDNGVAVVCDGASSAAVRLSVVRAVSAYTGFGSDKITVLQMEVKN